MALGQTGEKKMMTWSVMNNNVDNDDNDADNNDEDDDKR